MSGTVTVAVMKIIPPEVMSKTVGNLMKLVLGKTPGTVTVGGINLQPKSRRTLTFVGSVTLCLEQYRNKLKPTSGIRNTVWAVSYTHLRAHETEADL
eukprot:1708925-Amphidinium_carterae.1